MTNPSIRIKGARQHNLKNLDLEIPLNQITVVTGVSGSGKSSLAFDTLYAEGQRRYVETFSPYARQFMDRMDRPRVDKIEGIPPAIAIDRKDPVRTSRSTVGTMTEITDYVKLLYARLGQLHCRSCGKPVAPETTAHIWKVLKKVPAGSQVVITFPYLVDGIPADQIRQSLMQMGFDRLYVKNRIIQVEEWHPDHRRKEIPVMADRLILRLKDKERVMDSLEMAFRFGGGKLDIWIPPKGHYAFSNRLECARAPVAVLNTIHLCPTCSHSTAPWGPVIPVGVLAVPSASTWTSLFRTTRSPCKTVPSSPSARRTTAAWNMGT
jgi:excinuclease ABC subunit A